jgi:uncharacterized protein DUF6286
MTTQAGPMPARRQVDRRARRSARRVFRPRRVWPALLVAALLTAAGTLLAIEVISHLVGQPVGLLPYARITRWLTETSWQAVATIVGACVLLALGLCCLLAGLKPGRTGLVRLRTDDPDLVLGVTQRGLRTAVADAARHVDVVSEVRGVQVGRRRVHVSVVSPAQEQAEVVSPVSSAVEAKLEELGVARKVSVRAHQMEG